MKKTRDSRLPDLPEDTTSKEFASAMSRKLFEISCMAELGRFRSTLELPKILKSLYHKFLQIYHQYLKHKTNQLKKLGRQPTCSTGCSFCCQLMPSGISALEIIFIYDTLREEKLFSRMYRRFLERQEILEQVRAKYRGIEAGVPRGKKLNTDIVLTDYKQKRIPCPLLIEGNACGIYSVRPIVCREYFSCSPPAWCDPAHPHHFQALTIALPLPLECQDMLDKIDAALELSLPGAFSEAFVFFSTNITRFRPIKWT